jgi:hypothetical protein
MDITSQVIETKFDNIHNQFSEHFHRIDQTLYQLIDRNSHKLDKESYKNSIQSLQSSLIETFSNIISANFQPVNQNFTKKLRKVQDLVLAQSFCQPMSNEIENSLKDLGSTLHDLPSITSTVVQDSIQQNFRENRSFLIEYFDQTFKV